MNKSQISYTWKILDNKAKWVCKNLFWCGYANFDPLARENFQHLMFITVLFLVSTVGHIYPHISDWVTKSAYVLRGFELATYQREYDVLSCWAICNTLCCMWESDIGMTRCLLRSCKRSRTILKLHRTLNVVSQNLD